LLKWEVIGHSCEQVPQTVYFFGCLEKKMVF